MPAKRKRFSSGIINGAEIPPHFFVKDLDRRDIPVKVRNCDYPDCGEKGDYKAPKSRHNLEEYFWFCLEHVRQYNAAWDYYKGMKTEEIENAIRFSGVWERPTWPFGQIAKKYKKRDKAFREGFMNDDEAMEEAERVHRARESHSDPRFKAQLDALRELGLLPPVDFTAIKQRYRALVKRHHPDVAAAENDAAAPQAHEKIKRLNAAFTLLKEFFSLKE
jgi:curved DNA-binding protein CbpA